MRYVDQDGLVEGRESFVSRIDGLAAMMGPTARLALERPAQVETDLVLFRWRLANPDQSTLVSGAEVAVLAEARVVQLYSVVD